MIARIKSLGIYGFLLALLPSLMLSVSGAEAETGRTADEECSDSLAQASPAQVFQAESPTEPAPSSTPVPGSSAAVAPPTGNMLEGHVTHRGSPPGPIVTPSRSDTFAGAIVDTSPLGEISGVVISNNQNVSRLVPKHHDEFVGVVHDAEQQVHLGNFLQITDVVMGAYGSNMGRGSSLGRHRTGGQSRSRFAAPRQSCTPHFTPSRQAPTSSCMPPVAPPRQNGCH